MTQVLDYDRATKRPPSRALAFFAHAAAGYPLLLLGSLYGQWLLSWWVLGHRPIPSVDDPKYIHGASWMHLVSFSVLMGFIPAACGAAVLNTLYALNHRLRGLRLLARVMLVVVLWVGTIALLRWDPFRILYWWID